MRLSVRREARFWVAWLLSGLLLSQLAGCGFRLVGASSWPSEWPGVRLDNQLSGITGEDFAEQLRLRLLREGLQLEATPFAGLRLLALEQRKITSALDANGRAAEFELQSRLRFQVRAGGDWSPELAVVAQRRLSFDPSLALAKQQEEAAITAALERELIDLLLLRVAAELRGVTDAGAESPPPVGAWSAP